MKKVIPVFLLLLCGMAVQAVEPDASIVFDDPFVEFNIEHYYQPNNPGNEPYTVKTAKGGLSCIQIPGGHYGYFKVNDAVIGTADNNLIITLTYFDEGADNLKFQYNATGATNYKDHTIKKTNTNEWITATIILSDASFRNAQNNQADFRINAPNYIREITITKGVLNPNNEPAIPVAASSYSEFLGKSVAGYQIWFTAGTSTGGWVHWSAGTPPKPKSVKFEVYPDVSEYDDADMAQTGFAALGSGQPAKLFTSSNAGVINTHFKWMKDYGIDGVAVQRFMSSISTAIIHSEESPVQRVKRAAEANERIFYICYDISGGNDDTWTDVIKFDWVYNVERNNNLTQSPAYAKVGNKPVIQLWGAGFTSRPGTAAQTIELINFLKARGCYVIGGLPTDWRTESGDSKPGFIEAYKAFDMISPWLVGRFKDNNGADSRLTNNMRPDKTFCDQYGIEYMPVIFPGFAWSQWNSGSPNDAPRNAGEFMWRQAKNIKSLEVRNMYFAMFDEYDEGTAIMKNASDWYMIPTNQYFLTASADGYWLSSDFQLRTAGAAIEMLKGLRPVTATVPVLHSEGPVYYRNSFESMTTSYNYSDGTAQNTGTFKVDPCFKNPGIYSNVNAGTSLCQIQQATPHNGAYSVKVSGSISQNKDTKYYYKISETKIPVVPDMRISFWKNTADEAGRFVFVDILTKTGRNLRDNGYTTTAGESMQPSAGHGVAGGGWENFICKFGYGVLLGDTITNIVVGYENPGINTYTAYIDDILIDNGSSSGIATERSVDDAGKVYAANGVLYINGYAAGATVTVYNLTGQALRRTVQANGTIDLNVLPGLYIVKVQSGDKTDAYKVRIK